MASHSARITLPPLNVPFITRLFYPPSAFFNVHVGYDFFNPWRFSRTKNFPAGVYRYKGHGLAIKEVPALLCLTNLIQLGFDYINVKLRGSFLPSVI